MNHFPFVELNHLTTPIATSTSPFLKTKGGANNWTKERPACVVRRRLSKLRGTPPRQWCQQRSDGIGTSAPAYARSRMLRTDVACHWPREPSRPAFRGSAISFNYAWLTWLPRAYQGRCMETAGTGAHPWPSPRAITSG